MRKLFVIPLLLTVSAFGQTHRHQPFSFLFAAPPSMGAFQGFTPPAFGAYINPGTGWTPLTTGGSGTPAGFTPPAAALYVLSGGAWIPWTGGGGSGGAVTSITNSDSTLAISPTTGDVIAGLNLNQPNTWNAIQTIHLTTNDFIGFSVRTDSTVGAYISTVGNAGWTWLAGTSPTAGIGPVPANAYTWFDNNTSVFPMYITDTDIDPLVPVKMVSGSTLNGNIVCDVTTCMRAGAEVVSFSATPTFSNSVNTSRIVLTGSITSFTLGSGADGQSKTLCFKQGSGPFTVTAPSNVHGFFTVGITNADWNCQAFNYDAADSIWLATSPGVTNQ